LEYLHSSNNWLTFAHVKFGIALLTPPQFKSFLCRPRKCTYPDQRNGAREVVDPGLFSCHTTTAWSNAGSYGRKEVLWCKHPNLTKEKEVIIFSDATYAKMADESTPPTGKPSVSGWRTNS